MTKYRIYDEKNKARGTLQYFREGITGLKFPRDSEFNKRWLKNINDFLIKEKLKPVSSQSSFKKHKKSVIFPKRIQGLTFFIKKKNKARRVEFKEIV